MKRELSKRLLYLKRRRSKVPPFYQQPFFYVAILTNWQLLKIFRILTSLALDSIYFYLGVLTVETHILRVGLSQGDLVTFFNEQSDCESVPREISCGKTVCKL